jgi:BetI-type transcriptional repressor, C-terminal
MRAYGAAVATIAESRRAESVGATSFVQYLLTHERLRKRLVAANREIYALAAKTLLAHVPAAELPLPAAQFVKVVHALTEGLLILHALSPEVVTRDVIATAFVALVGRKSPEA